jgi:hypothetical protein
MLVIAAILISGCGQTRTFIGTYDEIWQASSLVYASNVKERENCHLANKPDDAPFGADGFGVIFQDVWITPPDDSGQRTPHKGRVYIRGQDIINPFPFLHGYPEYEQETLDKIESQLAQSQGANRALSERASD